MVRRWVFELQESISETRKEPLDPVPVKNGHKNKLKVPHYVLGQAELDDEEKRIQARGKSAWDGDDRLSVGERSVRTISLKENEDRVKFARMASATRTPNGEVLRRKIRGRSRHCANLINPDLYNGPAFDQRSCVGSIAQVELTKLASDVIEQYEQTVEFAERASEQRTADESRPTAPPRPPRSSQARSAQTSPGSATPDTAPWPTFQPAQMAQSSPGDDSGLVRRLRRADGVLSRAGTRDERAPPNRRRSPRAHCELPSSRAGLGPLAGR